MRLPHLVEPLGLINQVAFLGAFGPAFLVGVRGPSSFVLFCFFLFLFKFFEFLFLDSEFQFFSCFWLVVSQRD